MWIKHSVVNKILVILFGLSILPVLSGQKPIGTWTSYLPYGNASKLVVAENKIYCSTNGGVFYYDKSDNSMHKLSREDGLSDTEVSALGYSAESKTVILAYANANIDLIRGNNIFNIPDIKNKQIYKRK